MESDCYSIILNDLIDHFDYIIDNYVYIIIF